MHMDHGCSLKGYNIIYYKVVYMYNYNIGVWIIYHCKNIGCCHTTAFELFTQQATNNITSGLLCHTDYIVSNSCIIINNRVYGIEPSRVGWCMIVHIIDHCNGALPSCTA